MGNLSIRSKDEFLGDLMVLYGGIVAEEIILGETSNGSSNDLEEATALIKEFVGSYGIAVIKDKGVRFKISF